MCAGRRSTYSMSEAPAVEKSPYVGVVGTLLVVDALHELGNQEVQIGVALPMPVARKVDRHAVDRGGEIGAVIEIETAQEELVGLPIPAVLRDDQAGHGLEDLARAIERTLLELRGADRPLRGGLGDAHEAVVAAVHDDRVEPGGACRRRRGSRRRVRIRRGGRGSWRGPRIRLSQRRQHGEQQAGRQGEKSSGAKRPAVRIGWPA